MKGGSKSFTKAKLTTADGSREVFLWNLGNRDEYSQLDAYEIQVVGKLSLGGKEQDVLIKGTAAELKKLVVAKAA